jgi:formylglycine-generating enzyme required for sulfatase activity
MLGQRMAELQNRLAEKPKVFISYSRADGSALAEELVTGLQLAGFEAYLDKHDIEKAVDWEERLAGLILKSDTVVFIISPASVHSGRCKWEVDRAVELGKRLIPVQWIAVPEEEVPERLRRLNYTIFTQGQSFARPLSELVTALRQDVDWIRRHTLIGEQAARWKPCADSKKGADLLLRSSELAEAKSWQTRRKDDAPEITELQHAFLVASEAAERRAMRRSRNTTLLLAGLALLLVLGAVGWWKQAVLLEAYLWRLQMRPSVLTVNQEARHAAQPGSEFAECAGGCPVMVVVRAGAFCMGSRAEIGEKREHPRHPVTIARPFAVAKFELSFDEWDTCTRYGDCVSASADGGERGKKPAINVTWQDAKRYVEWLSRMTGKRYRLLSEAEWEYAARAGTTTHFSFGDDDAVLGEYAWFAANVDGGPHVVGALKSNAWGLHDMHGNVAEWVEDCFQDTYRGAPPNEAAWIKGNCSRRVIRGGSWRYDAKILRAASRDWLEIDKSHDDVGIRIARELDRPAPALPTLASCGE